MPQQTLARLTDLQERVENLEQEAVKAESEVARLRTLLSSRTTDATLDEITAARASFDNVYADAQLKRSRASAQAKLLERTKAWIEELPPNTRLVLVHAPIEGASLAQVRGELAALRSDLSKLRGNPPASLDIGKRIESYVNELADAAHPLVRGFANGQTLDVRWPMSTQADRRNGNGFSTGEANGLLLFAAIDPAAVSDLIFKAVHAAQPLSAQQHSEKMLQLNARVNELSYIEAALVERAGVEHSVETAPHCLLGVRVGGEIAEGDAAA
jgi:hypothetical protein